MTHLSFYSFFCRPYNRRQTKRYNSVSRPKEAKSSMIKLELKPYEIRENIAPSITAPHPPSQEDSRSHAICLLGFNTIIPTKQNRSRFLLL